MYTIQIGEYGEVDSAYVLSDVTGDAISRLLDRETSEFYKDYEFLFQEGITGYRVTSVHDGVYILTVQYWSYCDEYEETELYFAPVTIY